MTGGSFELLVPASAAVGANSTLFPASSGSNAVDAQPTIAEYYATFRPGVPVPRGFADPANLTQFEAPSLMTEWELQSIYLPVAVYQNGGITLQNLSLEAILKVNGIVRWRSTLQIVEGGSYVAGQSSVIGDNFPNPIRVPPRGTVSLSASMAFQYTNTTAWTLQPVFGAGGTIFPGLSEDDPGIISYQVNELAGARGL